MKSSHCGCVHHAIGILLLAILATGCAHRSTQILKGAFPYGPEIKKVRIEMENGTLDIAADAGVKEDREISYGGGLRIDSDTAEGLAELEAVEAVLTATPDPDEPGTLVIRCPRPPDGLVGMIAYEGNIRISAQLPLEVVVRNNGHVAMVGREASSKVTTRRGDLRFERCSGGVEANTGQGIVIAFQHEGDLDVRTGLGDMQVFVTKPGEQITLSTGKGTVQCHVPEDIEFEVDARAEIGRIGNDFGLEVRKVGDYSAAMVGRRGSATTKVILRTAAGHISLIARK